MLFIVWVCSFSKMLPYSIKFFFNQRVVNIWNCSGFCKISKQLHLFYDVFLMEQWSILIACAAARPAIPCYSFFVYFLFYFIFFIFSFPGNAVLQLRTDVFTYFTVLLV